MRKRQGASLDHPAQRQRIGTHIHDVDIYQQLKTFSQQPAFSRAMLALSKMALLANRSIYLSTLQTFLPMEDKVTLEDENVLRAAHFITVSHSASGDPVWYFCEHVQAACLQRLNETRQYTPLLVGLVRHVHEQYAIYQTAHLAIAEHLLGKIHYLSELEKRALPASDQYTLDYAPQIVGYMYSQHGEYEKAEAIFFHEILNPTPHTLIELPSLLNAYSAILKQQQKYARLHDKMNLFFIKTRPYLNKMPYYRAYSVAMALALNNYESPNVPESEKSGWLGELHIHCLSLLNSIHPTSTPEDLAHLYHFAFRLVDLLLHSNAPGSAFTMSDAILNSLAPHDPYHMDYLIAGQVQLGHASSQLNLFQRANDSYLNALSLIQRYRPALDRSYLWYQVGANHLAAERPRDALQAFLRGLPLFRAMAHPPVSAMVFFNKMAEAKALLASMTSSSDPTQYLAQAYYELATAEEEASHFEIARQCYQEAYHHFQKSLAEGKEQLSPTYTHPPLRATLEDQLNHIKEKIQRLTPSTENRFTQSQSAFFAPRAAASSAEDTSSVVSGLRAARRVRLVPHHR